MPQFSRRLPLIALSVLAACGPQAQSPEQEDNAGAATPATQDGRPAGFAACSVCHAVEPGKTGVGPSLFGIAGRAAGTVPGYSYSAAMRDSGLVWDEATLDGYILAPHKVVPGTKMAYPGLKDDKKRAEIVAWLATLK